MRRENWEIVSQKDQHDLAMTLIGIMPLGSQGTDLTMQALSRKGP